MTLKCLSLKSPVNDQKNFFREFAMEIIQVDTLVEKASERLKQFFQLSRLSKFEL